MHELSMFLDEGLHVGVFLLINWDVMRRDKLLPVVLQLPLFNLRHEVQTQVL